MYLGRNVLYVPRKMYDCIEVFANIGHLPYFSSIKLVINYLERDLPMIAPTVRYLMYELPDPLLEWTSWNSDIYFYKGKIDIHKSFRTYKVKNFN